MAVTTDGIRQQEMELKQQLEDLKSAQAGLTATQAVGWPPWWRARPDSRAALSQGSSV